MTTAGTVTLLFSDIVGSTEVLERLGDDAAGPLLRAHFRMLREAVAARAGREVKNLGDGLMVVFASAVDAIGCAVAMQQAVDRHNREPGEHRLEVRVGLHVGEPIHAEEDYFGMPVVIAKRLCASAQGAQIVASQLVRSLVGTRGGYTFRDLGAVALKGLSEPLPACEVVWEPAQALHLPLPPWFAAVERTAFVGRKPDLGHLREAWERTRAGHRQLILLVGEPGIGKTRLAAEFARTVHAEGATVLLGRSSEETLRPYQPFVEALHHYAVGCPLHELRARVRAKDGAELTRLVPALVERLPDLPAPLGGDPEGQRYRLFEAVASLLADVSRAAPVLLVLDDLHWADKSTLLLLKHIARWPAQSPLMLLGTCRETEISAALAETLADLRRDHPFERLAVTGLGEEDVGVLIGAVAGHEAPPPLTRAVHERTEGNPFFIQEVLRHLAECGATYQPDGRWTANLAIEQLGIPEGVKEVIGGRLARLNKRCNRTLTIAAVIGREFGLDVLERTSDLASQRLLDALEEAVAARVIAEVPRAVGRYSFVHALIRETLYSGLTTTRRVRLHRQIGEVLETLYGQDPGPHAAELAHHFFEAARAGDAQKAGHYARQAAEQAMRLLAYEEAVGHYQRALHALELAAPVDEAERSDLLLALGGAQARAGDSANARETFLSAAESARRMAAPERFARAALGFGGMGPIFGPSPGSTDEVLLGLLEEALSTLPVHDSTLRARLLAKLAMALYWSESGERRESLSRQAVEMATRTGDAATRAAVLGMRHSALFAPENVEERLAVATAVLRLAEETGDHEAALDAHHWRVEDLLELGDIAAVDLEIEFHDRLARELQQPLHIGFTLMFRAMRALMDGRFAEGEKFARESFVIGRNPYFMAQMFWLYKEQGRLLDLQTVMGDILERAAPLAAARSGLALTLCELGLAQEARAEFEALASKDFADLRRDVSWLGGVTMLAQVCTFLGDARRAASLCQLLLPHAGRNIVVGRAAVCFGPVSYYLGRLAATMARTDEAAAQLDEAIRMSEAMGARPFVAHTQHAYAAVLLARGERTRALELLDRALSTAEELGMKPLVEKVLALKRRPEGRAASDITT